MFSRKFSRQEKRPPGPSSAKQARRTRRDTAQRFRRLLCEPLESRWLLSTLTVLNGSDSGPGSLRQTIADAAPGDTIVFATSLAGQTVKLTSGVMEIAKPLTIQGLGADQLTVDGKGNAFSSPAGIFKVRSTVAAAISGLTISGSSSSFSSGAGIQNAGTLTISDCLFSGNSAGHGGGIAFDGTYGGTLTVTGSLFVGNAAITAGAAIYYSGTSGGLDSLVVDNCHFTGNTGDAISLSRGRTVITRSQVSNSSGLGILTSWGSITVSATTLSGNKRGGISVTFGGLVRIINSTVSGNGQNAFQGGGIYNEGTLEVQNSTIARNAATGTGAGIYQRLGSTTLENTIVAHNANATAPDIYGSISATSCLIGSTYGAGSISGTGNILDQDPLLAWLGDYGGPVLPGGTRMQTMPPLIGSPALDAGSTLLIPPDTITDQRGGPRVLGGSVDIGACEGGSPTPVPNIRTVTNSNDSGVGSLREAILRAAAGDVIRFDSSLSGQTVRLASGVLEISRPLNIQGLGAEQLTIDGKDNSLSASPGVFKVLSNATVDISGIRVTGSSSGFTNGAVIQDAGTLTVSDCLFSGNTSGSGGVIAFDGSYGGTVTVRNSTFAGNTGLVSGAGIHYWGSDGGLDSLVVVNCHFTASTGDAITLSSGRTAIANTQISNSTGIGISNSWGSVTITGSTLSGNKRGGVSIKYSGGAQIINSTLFGNGRNAFQGGGIYSEGTLLVQNSTITRNEAAGDGGGIYRYLGTTTLENTIVALNANAKSPDISGPVSATNCLIGNTFGAGVISGSGNILDRDPRLAWLGDYGGRVLPDGTRMQTTPLLAGSPAIDAGSNGLIPADVIADQRGLYRVVNGTVDIGACENQPPAEHALIRQIARLSPATFDGAGADVALGLGAVVSGQEVEVFVGQSLDGLRSVGRFVNNSGELPWRLSIDIRGVNLARVEHVAVASSQSLLILSAVGFHQNLTDLSGYEHLPAVAADEPPSQQPANNAAKLYRWDWDSHDFIPLPKAEWRTPSVIDWKRKTIVLTHGWNSCLVDRTCRADFIWDFATDFMNGRTTDEYRAFNLLAVDWYDGGKENGSDPNDTRPGLTALYEYVNIGDAQKSAVNGIAAAKVLANDLKPLVSPAEMILIGHSNGAGFMASLAKGLRRATGESVAELVALDAPTITNAWEEVEAAVMDGIRTSNYYMPFVQMGFLPLTGQLGFGKPILTKGKQVFNFSLDATATLLDLNAGAGSGHVELPRRYAGTADNWSNHSNSWGFRESRFVKGGSSLFDSSAFWSETVIPGQFRDGSDVIHSELTVHNLEVATQRTLDRIATVKRSIWDAGVRVVENIGEALKGLNAEVLIAGDIGHIFGAAHSPVYGSIEVNIPANADVLEFDLSVMDPGNSDRLLVAVGDEVLQEIELASAQSLGGVKSQLWIKDYAGQTTTVTFYVPSDVASTAEFLVSDIQFVTLSFPPVTSEPHDVAIESSMATFAVTYFDPDDAVAASTIDGKDILVTGPNGYSQSAELVGVDADEDGSTQTATYRIRPPGQAWKPADEGEYLAWVQENEVGDTAGNYVLAGIIGELIIQVPPGVPPEVTSSIPGALAPTNAMTETFAVTFSEWVENVDATDFQLSRTGTAEGVIAAVTPVSGTAFTVAVTDLAGDGTLRLDLKAGNDVQNVAGVAATPYSSGVALILDHLAPAASVAAVVPDPRNTPAGAVGVSFNESVTGLDVNDLRLTRNGVTVSLDGLTVAPLSDMQYAIDLSTVSAVTGTYVLTFVAAGSGVRDLAGNPVADDAATAFVVHPWQNVMHVCDVNDDSEVTPIDALLIINAINFGVTGPIVLPGGEPPFVDADGDDALTASDVLAVINFLNRRSSDAGGEGEAAFLTGVPSGMSAAEPVSCAAVPRAVSAGGIASAASGARTPLDSSRVAYMGQVGRRAITGTPKRNGTDGLAGQTDRLSSLKELDEVLDILAPVVSAAANWHAYRKTPGAPR